MVTVNDKSGARIMAVRTDGLSHGAAALLCAAPAADAAFISGRAVILLAHSQSPVSGCRWEPGDCFAEVASRASSKFSRVYTMYVAVGLSRLTQINECVVSFQCTSRLEGAHENAYLRQVNFYKRPLFEKFYAVMSVETCMSYLKSVA